MLVSYGITESRELMRLMYGPEVELVSEAIGGARTGTQRQLRIAALWVRRQRAKRRREKEAKVSAPVTNPALSREEKNAAAIEILPPELDVAPTKATPKTSVQIDAEPVPAKKKQPARKADPKTKASKKKAKSKSKPAKRGAKSPKSGKKNA